jgi:hypothetical protein
MQGYTFFDTDQTQEFAGRWILWVCSQVPFKNEKVAQKAKK